MQTFCNQIQDMIQRLASKKFSSNTMNKLQAFIQELKNINQRSSRQIVTN